MGVELIHMSYEAVVFGVIFFLCIAFELDYFRSRIRTPISCRGVWFCGCVSVALLFAVPRLFIWPSVHSLSILVLLSFIIALTAWVLAYHEA